ncbi:hypothetical protein K8S17_03235, partial [bacterium]|nr:hypothetical protein [bacterium]
MSRIRFTLTVALLPVILLCGVAVAQEMPVEPDAMVSPDVLAVPDTVAPAAPGVLVARDHLDPSDAGDKIELEWE